MDIVEEEENNEIKNELKNTTSKSNLRNINTDFSMVDLSSTEPTPTHYNTFDKNLYNNKMNVISNKFVFKPYLTSKDECKFDENIFLEKEINELHKLKTNYLNYQPDLSIRKRFILIDWIMEVSSQLHFKRKTYYSCVNLIDLYFSKCIVNTNQIQLVGITCLLISAKNEENIIPQLSLFAMVCDNSYSKSEIINQEFTVLKALNWKIQYNNLSDYGNMLTLKWDSVINTLNKDSNKSDKFPLFRNDPEYKDLLLDHFFQFLDYISLDYFFNFLHEKYICVSVIYIIIGVAKKVFSYENAFEFFNNLNPQNNEKFRIYQHFFSNFSKQYFKINMIEILDVLKYVCLFSVIKFETSFKDINNINNELTHEERNQIQRYNKNNSFNFKKLKEIREANNLNV